MSLPFLQQPAADSRLLLQPELSVDLGIWEEPRMSRADAARWAQGLDAVVERPGARFGRVEPRRRALAYLRGLLSPIERKNGWQLAEVAGDRTPDGVQDFLSRAHWEADLVRDDLRAYVVEHLGDEQAVLV